MSDNSASGNDRLDAVNNALAFAIERGNMNMISLAMERGGSAKTLLDAGIKKESMEMIELSLKKGGDPEELLVAGINRSTPKGDALNDRFARAAGSRTGLSWVQAALDHGANPNMRRPGAKEKTYAVLHFAQDNFKANAGIIDLLITHGANVDEPSPLGTPLMRAVTATDVEAIDYYMSKGADPTFVCEELKSFPMKALEENGSFSTADKERLLMLMMERMPAAPADTPAPVTAGNDIKIHKPLELKVPPKPERPQKTFTL
jgi:hypothetical protein